MPDDAREHILQTAASLFAQQGFAKTSMNDIVRASGVSKGGVYWHFTSKDEIITAILDQFFNGQNAVLAAALAESSVPVNDRLIRLARSSGEGLQTVAAQFPSSLEFYAFASSNPTLRTRLTGYFQQYRADIRQMVEQAVASGEWSPVDADTAADAFIALFEGILLLWGVIPNAFDLTQRLEGALSLFLKGVTSPNT